MRLLTTTLLLLVTTTSVLAADSTAQIKNRDGATIGTAEFTVTASGMIHVDINLEGIPEGKHGVHVHETGDCSAADFTSAGGHLAGGREHGMLVEGGPHPGDLPNATVDADQRLRLEAFSTLLNHSGEGEGAMFDADGSAVIVHSGPDDYTSQPSGAAGDRIACGVIETNGG